MAVDYEVLALQLEGTAQMLSEARRENKKLQVENGRLQAIERRLNASIDENDLCTEYGTSDLVYFRDGA